MPTKYTIDVFLREDTFLDGHTVTDLEDSPDRGILHVADAPYGNSLAIFGTPAELRKVAERMLRLADEVERDSRRQRALDNAPRRRTKFVAEPAVNGKEMKIAA